MLFLNRVTYFFGQEIRPYGGLVLVGEFLVDVLIHQRCFANSGVTEDDHLEQDFLTSGGRGGHGVWRTSGHLANFGTTGQGQVNQKQDLLRGTLVRLGWIFQWWAERQRNPEISMEYTFFLVCQMGVFFLFSGGRRWVSLFPQKFRRNFVEMPWRIDSIGHIS